MAITAITTTNSISVSPLISALVESVFMAGGKVFFPLLWEGFKFGGHPKAAQFARDGADAVDAVDHFLPDVGAFVVNEGGALDPTFERDFRLAQARPEPRNPRLDARG